MPVLHKRIHFWLVGWLGAILVRALHATWRVELIGSQRVWGMVGDGSGAVIVAFWHRHILTMLAQHRGYKVCVPVSEHRDGEYVAQVMDRFGLASVRGSTTRGSIRLLKGLMALIREGWSPAITPDGPRGPRFSVQPGFVMLARRSGLPVHPVGVAAKRALVLKSWDGFVIPLPFARVAVVLAEPLWASQYPDRGEFCRALKEGLMAATERAEQAVQKA